MAKHILIALVMINFFACKSSSELETVDAVDIQKYAGTWHEIARLPNSFEKGLECVTAKYRILDENKIEVINGGINAEDKSRKKDITGSAWVPNEKYPGRLKVRFFWPQAANYYIIALDDDYQYALVGTPSRKYLWVLSKSKALEDTIYKEMLEIASRNGFPVENMIKVRQDCN